ANSANMQTQRVCRPSALQKHHKLVHESCCKSYISTAIKMHVSQTLQNLVNHDPAYFKALP
ncbi:MAG: hypothetical protein ACXV8P_11485, partial [Methylobacter sp.]